MRTITILAFALVLAGCGTETGDSKVTAIQAATVKACKFLPTASSVAAILTASNPAVTGISAVATAICSAMSGQARGLKSGDKPCPQVNGVCVEGEYVEPDKED